MAGVRSADATRCRHGAPVSPSDDPNRIPDRPSDERTIDGDGPAAPEATPTTFAPAVIAPDAGAGSPVPRLDRPPVDRPPAADAPPVAEAASDHAVTKAPSSRVVAALLAAAALVAAIITTVASFASNEATGLWQQSLREEVKSAAAVVEDVRYVYTVEARQSFRYTTARVREAEYRRVAATLTGDLRAQVEFEATVQQKVADAIKSSSDLASDPRYELPSGGYDLIRRLADARARYPELAALDPEATADGAQRPARRATALLGATTPVGLAFMFGALAQAFIHRRKLLLVLGAGSLVAAIALAVLIMVTL